MTTNEDAIRNDPKVQQWVALMSAYMAPHIAAGLSPEQAMEKGFADYHALINKLSRTGHLPAGHVEPTRSREYNAMRDYVLEGFLRRVGKQ